MPKQGTTFHGPLSVKEGGLKLFDAAGRKSSEELLARVEIPAATLLSVTAAGPVATLAPAPGTNKFIEILTVNLFYRHGGVNFTTSGGTIRVGTPNLNSLFQINIAGFLDQATSQLRTLLPAAANSTPIINEELQIRFAGVPTGVAAGNGSLLALVSYRIQDLS